MESRQDEDDDNDTGPSYYSNGFIANKQVQSLKKFHVHAEMVFDCLKWFAQSITHPPGGISGLLSTLRSQFDQMLNSFFGWHFSCLINFWFMLNLIFLTRWLLYVHKYTHTHTLPLANSELAFTDSKLKDNGKVCTEVLIADCIGNRVDKNVDG